MIYQILGRFKIENGRLHMPAGCRCIFLAFDTGASHHTSGVAGGGWQI